MFSCKELDETGETQVSLSSASLKGLLRILSRPSAPVHVACKISPPTLLPPRTCPCGMQGMSWPDVCMAPPLHRDLPGRPDTAVQPACMVVVTVTSAAQRTEVSRLPRKCGQTMTEMHHAWRRGAHAGGHIDCCILVNASWLQGPCVSMHPGYKFLRFNASWLQGPCVSMHPGYKFLRFNASCMAEGRTCHAGGHIAC